jgi:hypothetical protein
MIMKLGSVTIAFFAGLAVVAQGEPLVSTDYCYDSIVQNRVHAIWDVGSVAALIGFHP